MSGVIFRSFWLAGGLGLLLVGAATTNFWDDECNGFFLAQQPPKVILRLLSVGFHDDPPLFDLLAHGWQSWAAYDPFALRLLPLGFWLVALAGLRRLGVLLGGREAGSWVLATAVVMPYHWLLPAAFRWYTLFAALSVWNTCWLLQATGAGGGEDRDGWRKVGWLYVLSGALLWYTSSAAPIIFAGQLALLLTILPGQRRPELWRWIAAQACVAFLYLPWLPTFIGQLHRSAGVELGATLRAGLHAHYALWVGEVSLPYQWWISLPAGAALLAAGCLIWRLRSVLPLRGALLALLVILAMLTPVIGVKRMIVASPFLALVLGLMLAQPVTAEAHWPRRCFLVASSLALVGCGLNYVRRDDWLSYRWLLPMRETVAGLQNLPGAPLLLTNSNGAAFYAQATPGIYLAGRFPERLDAMSLLPTPLGLEGPALARLQARASTEDAMVYLHESAFAPYRVVADSVESRLSSWGFRVVRREFLFPASERYLRHHPSYGPGTPAEDRARLVLVYFERRR